MFCSKCGNKITDGATFCSACGQATSTPAPLASGLAPAYAAPTPTAVITPSLPSPYAGFWLRVVAHLIDDVLLGIGIGILVLLGVGMVGVESIRTMFANMNGENPEIPAAMISAILFVSLASILLAWIYNAAMESSRHQGTLGKMALGLTVTDLGGRPIGFGLASGRYFAKIITGLIPLGIGYAMAGFTEKKQALHDMIASCLVLRKT